MEGWKLEMIASEISALACTGLSSDLLLRIRQEKHDFGHLVCHKKESIPLFITFILYLRQRPNDRA